MTGRADPHPRMFDVYAECVAALARRDIGGVRESAAGDSDVRRARDATGWTLRRFERDLLAELGYALPLRRVAGSGAAVGSASTYAYDPEAGPLETRVPGDSLRVRGSALLALA